MKIERYKTEGNLMPLDFEVKRLGGTLFEITESRNVETLEKINEEGDKEIYYKYDLTILKVNIKTREDGVVALIRLRYSQDDEFNRINDGIDNPDDAKYLEYRDYVEFCKEQSFVYFDFEVR